MEIFGHENAPLRPSSDKESFLCQSCTPLLEFCANIQNKYHSLSVDIETRYNLMEKNVKVDCTACNIGKENFAPLKVVKSNCRTMIKFDKLIIPKIF